MRLKTTGTDRTFEAVRRQIEAMGWDIFEVGLFKPEAVDEPIMMPRTWDKETLLRSVPWMRLQNRNGRNVYVRPKGEHHLSLVDDLTAEAVEAMKREGFSPALVVRTSPGNHQAWVKHPGRLDRELGTAVARALAERFGGDRGAADWRHFGRMSGFANRKSKYCDSTTGLYPFVLLLEAEGRVYPAAERFLREISAQLELQHQERKRLQDRACAQPSTAPEPLKSIDAFRSVVRYGGDGNRIDLAYAIYALAHGIEIADVSAAIRSRDLSHKGNERRQDEYVNRTIKKALDAVERLAVGRGR